MRNIKIICIVLLLFPASLIFSQSISQSIYYSYKEGISALENKQYPDAYKKFTEAIFLGKKDYSSNKTISELYYLRALTVYSFNETDNRILQDLDESLSKYNNLDALLLYATVIKTKSQNTDQFLRNFDDEKNSDILNLSKSLIYAITEEKSCSNKAFFFLKEALNLGYNDVEFLLGQSNRFDRICNGYFYEILAQYSLITSIQQYKIKYYVENQINQWQKKGKFEKTTDYQVRVNEQTRKQQIDYLIQSYIDSVGMKKIDLTNLSNDYDADNEIFKIKTENLGPIYVPVPINEARSFDENFTMLQYEKAKFTLYNDNFEMLHLEIVNPANKKRYTYDSKNVTAFGSSQLVLNFDEIDIDLDNTKPIKNSKEESKEIIIGKSDVDLNIPITSSKNNKTYALIIGNEDYKSYQTGLKVEQNVEFAANDAQVFKKYCINTLGIPEQNIIFTTNAGVVKMKQVFNQLNSVIKNLNGQAEIIVYYAGHGFPNEQTKEAYLIPVDVSSNSLDMALKLTDIYKGLTQYPSIRILVFLDACFTGGGRDMGLFASRGVSIKPKDEELKGNLVVFSASSGVQSSQPYYDKGHGIFTYFLLKKLQDSKGNVSLGDLDKYISESVSIRSSLLNGREQNPKTNVSMDIMDDWGSWKILNDSKL